MLSDKGDVDGVCGEIDGIGGGVDGVCGEVDGVCGEIDGIGGGVDGIGGEVGVGSDGIGTGSSVGSGVGFRVGSGRLHISEQLQRTSSKKPSSRDAERIGTSCEYSSSSKISNSEYIASTPNGTDARSNKSNSPDACSGSTLVLLSATTPKSRPEVTLIKPW